MLKPPTFAPGAGQTNSWPQIIICDAFLVGLCVVGLVFIDHGNGNFEPPEAPIWYMSLYSIVVAPPYLLITKALGRHRKWRIAALCLWGFFAILAAFVLFISYALFMLATW